MRGHEDVLCSKAVQWLKLAELLRRLSLLTY